MSKVRGIERFADAMSGCKGGYVLIGGGACSVLFDNEGDSFRATEDLDVVELLMGKALNSPLHCGHLSKLPDMRLERSAMEGALTIGSVCPKDQGKS